MGNCDPVFVMRTGFLRFWWQLMAELDTHMRTNTVRYRTKVKRRPDPFLIVFTCSKGLPGVGFSRPEWNDSKNMQSGTVSRTITDDTLPGGPRERAITYTAPFDRCDREKDYEVAWAAFVQRGLK